MALEIAKSGKYAPNKIRDHLGEDPEFSSLSFDNEGLQAKTYNMSHAKLGDTAICVHYISTDDKEEQVTRNTYGARHFEASDTRKIAKTLKSMPERGVLFTEALPGVSFADALVSAAPTRRRQLSDEVIRLMMEVAHLTEHEDHFGPFFWVKRWRKLAASIPEGPLHDQTVELVETLHVLAGRMLGNKVRKGFMPTVDPLEFICVQDDVVAMGYAGPFEDGPLMRAIADLITRLTLIAPNRKRQFVWGVSEMYWGAAANSPVVSAQETALLLPLFTGGSWVERAAAVDELSGDQYKILQRAIREFVGHAADSVKNSES